MELKGKLLVICIALYAGSFAQLAGTYKIGSGELFTTIGKAVDSLNIAGITSSVTFQIKSGTYNERVVINNFPGESEVDTVLFISETENPDDVLIALDAPDSLNNYLFKLNGCERVTLKYLGFQTASNNYSCHVLIQNGAKFNRVEECNFNAPVGVSSAGNNGTVINSVQDGISEEYNTFCGNYIHGGNIGIHIGGKDFANKERGNSVLKNVFDQQTQAAFSTIYQQGGEFALNGVIYEQSQTAVWIASVDSAYYIYNNNIVSNGAQGLNISTHDAQSLADTMLIINNMISCPNGTALHINSSNGLAIAHNTLYNASKDHYTLELDNIENAFLINNLFVKNADSTIVRFTNEIGNVAFDNNGFHSKNGMIGLRDSGPILTFNAWQTSANTPGANSVFSNSFVFRNNGFDLTPYCGMPDVFKTTNYLDKLSKDFHGHDRDPSSCWRGAAEFILPDYHTADFSGYVTDGTDTLKSGQVIVFGDTSKDKTLLDTLSTGFISPDGSYNFNSVKYVPDYWLKVIPTNGNSGNFIESYHGSELRWDDEVSYKLSDSCSAHIQNISPRKLNTVISGDFVISGNVSTTDPGGQVEGTDPIPGLDVVLDKIPPARNTIATTQTDINGNYSFENLPEGTYLITIDYAGLPADTIYEVVLDSNSNEVVNVDYCVDTTTVIEGCMPSQVGSKEVEVLKGVNVYPNPMNNQLIVDGMDEPYTYQLVNLDGRVILNSGSVNGQQILTVENLSKGTYFVKVNSVSENVYKVFKVVK